MEYISYHHILLGYFTQNILFRFMQVYCVFNAIDVGDISDVSCSFSTIVDTFYFRYVSDVIDNNSFTWCFDDFLHKICMWPLINYFPCIRTSVKYLYI